MPKNLDFYYIMNNVLEALKKEYENNKFLNPRVELEIKTFKDCKKMILKCKDCQIKRDIYIKEYKELAKDSKSYIDEIYEELQKDGYKVFNCEEHSQNKDLVVIMFDENYDFTQSYLKEYLDRQVIIICECCLTTKEESDGTTNVPTCLEKIELIREAIDCLDCYCEDEEFDLLTNQDEEMEDLTELIEEEDEEYLPKEETPQ